MGGNAKEPWQLGVVVMRAAGLHAESVRFSSPGLPRQRLPWDRLNHRAVTLKAFHRNRARLV
jgi:hypothetical protein